MSERSRTEARNPRARSLSTLATREILELMNDEDATVPTEQQVFALARTMCNR